MTSIRSRSLLLAFVFSVSIVSLAPGDAEARPRPRGFGKSNFEANKTFGLGLILGNPTGLSGKYFVGPSTAIDFAVGAVGCCRGRRGLELHADFLWHPISLVSAEPFELPLYFGVGGRFYQYNWDRDRRDYDGSAIGVRVPGGIAFDFNNVPLDIFIELALVLDFLFDDPYDDVYVDLDGAVGIRYWFN